MESRSNDYFSEGWPTGWPSSFRETTSHNLTKDHHDRQ